MPSLYQIGTLHGDIHSTKDAPKYYTESSACGEIEIFAEYTEAIDGIKAGQTIVVLFWLHKAGREQLKVHPRGDKTRPKRGVFSTRSPHRPNPIAVSELEVLEVTGNRIRVKNLDILNDTPVIDIKMKA